MCQPVDIAASPRDIPAHRLWRRCRVEYCDVFTNVPQAVTPDILNPVSKLGSIRSKHSKFTGLMEIYISLAVKFHGGLE